LNPVSHYKGHPRAAFPPPFNPYQAGIFKLAQRPGFGIGLDAPLLQHQVGNDEGVGLS
jgi:hypothetical protein